MAAVTEDPLPARALQKQQYWHWKCITFFIMLIYKVNISLSARGEK
jgi:hypothetical protein